MNGTTTRARGRWWWLPPVLVAVAVALLMVAGGWAMPYQVGLMDGAPCEQWQPPCTPEQAGAALDLEGWLSWAGAGLTALGLVLDTVLARPVPDDPDARPWGAARVAATTAAGWVLVAAAGTVITYVTAMGGGIAAVTCCAVLTAVALYVLVAVVARRGGATRPGARRASLGALVVSAVVCLGLLEASGQNPVHNGEMPAGVGTATALVLALGLPVVIASAAAVRAGRTGRAARAK